MRRLVVWVSAILTGVGAACATFSAPDDTTTDGGIDAAASDAPALDDAPADAGSPYANVILDAGPIAYWRMGITTGVIIPDESGHSNNLVLQGGSGFVLGVPGAIHGDSDTAISFDGNAATAIASMPGAFNFPAGHPFSIELWAKRDKVDAGVGSEHFIDHYQGTPEGGVIGFQMYYAVHGLPPYSAFEIDSENGIVARAQGDAGDFSKWEHYVAVLDTANDMLIYLNGTASKPMPGPGPTGTTNAVLVVASGFPGAIDEIAVYDRALSLEEVNAHASFGQP